MPHRMETVLVAEAPGQSVDWDLARDLLQNPAARIIACDPIAFQGALRINENVVTTKAFLTPTDLAVTDRQVGKQLDGCRGVDIIEQRTGLQLTFLAVRLYGDLRPRLSRHLPGVSALPLILPNNPSRADIRAARDVASSWSSRLGLEHSEEIPSPVQALAVDRLREALSLELPLVFARSRSARNALKRFKPHVVLQMEDISPWGRSLAALARTALAWTVVVQHGLTGEGLYGSHVMPAVAHRHACWGKSAMRWNLDHGAPPDSQIIIGNPMLEEHFRGNPPITVASEMPREIAFISQPFVLLSPAAR